MRKYQADMRKLLRTSGLALVLWISLGSLASSGPPEPAKAVPNPQSGEIDGAAGDAGRVVLRAQDQTDPNLVLELLSVGSAPAGRVVRKAVGESGDGVLMPAGKAVGALWDREARRYVALSRPFEVRARETVEIPLERPTKGADLVVEARRHARASTAADDDVAVSLQRGDGALPPDLKVATADAVYAVWYGLAPGPAEVRAQSQQASHAPQPVNLPAGSIERLTVQLKPRAMVSGTVYRGDEAHRATLTFTTVTQKAIKVRTDDNGAYALVLLDPLRKVAIELDGVKGGPYTEFFSPVIAEAQERDLRVPKSEPRVRVVDAATGKGIPKAAVIARNHPLEVSDEDVREQETVSLELVTDAAGVAWLPPLRRGSLEMQATAEGYLPMQPVEERAEGGPNEVFEIPLEPVGETVALRLRLPDGAPAARADVSLVDSLVTGASLFTARADAEGLVQAPRKQAGVFLVKHPAAGFLVREWQPQSGDEEPEWVLPAPAGQRLTIQVTDASGQNAVPDAELALWVQDHRLAGATLAWLTGTRPMADNTGMWTATNLPRGPVAVLAWGPRMRAEAWAGHLDAQASEADPPWPDPLVVRATE